MVGYYQTEPIPSPATMSMAGSSSAMPSLDASTAINSVKSLVCSPDLTVFSSESRPSSPPSTGEDKSYRCLLCRKSFDQKSLYQSHLRSHGKEGEDPYRCNICGKTFAVPARLTRHYRTHTGEKPYQCEYCSKSFSVKENLSVHRRIHTKERPYKCDVCERAFEHSGKLHRHMRIHTGERPHKCTVCSKTFIQSGQLVIHMRTHTGEKPYVCKSCGKGFTCSKQLKVHTRTHTGEKPYTCDMCGKSFGYNHVLKLHQVGHYAEKVYKCTLCHETFGSKKTMEMHTKTHSDTPPSGGTSPREDSPPVEAAIEATIDASPSSSSSPSSLSSNPSIGTCEDNGEAKLEPSSAPFSYYLYSRDRYQTDDTFQVGPMEPSRDFLYPTGDVVTYGASYATYAYSGTPYGFPNDRVSSLLDLPGNDARRRVEAALEAVEEESQRVVQREPILTPPSSNPVSPAPSPDPLDLAIPVRETLILPPRKRCKMILESMESERTSLVASQRQNSVIQFARAS